MIIRALESTDNQGVINPPTPPNAGEMTAGEMAESTEVNSGESSGSCTPGLCKVCENDEATMPAEDDNCPPVSCGALTQFEQVTESNGGTSCVSYPYG